MSTDMTLLYAHILSFIHLSLPSSFFSFRTSNLHSAVKGLTRESERNKKHPLVSNFPRSPVCSLRCKLEPLSVSSIRAALTRSEICRGGLRSYTRVYTLPVAGVVCTLARLPLRWRGARKIAREPSNCRHVKRTFCGGPERPLARLDESFLSFSSMHNHGHETFQLNYARGGITSRLDGFSSPVSWPRRHSPSRPRDAAVFFREH